MILRFETVSYGEVLCTFGHLKYSYVVFMTILCLLPVVNFDLMLCEIGTIYA
jgi:hypothetical protein